MRALRQLGILFVVLALVSGCTGDGDSDDSGAPPAQDSAATVPDDATSTPTGGDSTLGPDMVRIEGSVTAGSADAAADGDLEGPFTMQVPSRGGGNGAVFNPVSVDGASASIVWDGGRPLSLDGPALHFDGGWSLDGGVLAFDLASGAVALPPGAYSVAGPVAVGDPSGLASPADQVSFVAGAGSAIAGTGQSYIHIPGAVTLLGPGSLDLSGTFTMTTADGSTAATTVHLADESFELTLTPSGDGSVHVTGIAAGAGWS